MSDAPGRFEAPPPARPPREPLFNVPLVALLIAASIPLLYLFQRDLPDMGMSMAFAPVDLEEGRWSGLLTAMLLHGGWAHAWMNAVGALAFGAPVARLLGDRIGPMVFLLFYVACGVLATLGLWADPLGIWRAYGRGVGGGVRPDRGGDAADGRAARRRRAGADR